MINTLVRNVRDLGGFEVDKDDDLQLIEDFRDAMILEYNNN